MSVETTRNVGSMEQTSGVALHPGLRWRRTLGGYSCVSLTVVDVTAIGCGGDGEPPTSVSVPVLAFQKKVGPVVSSSPLPSSSLLFHRA